MNLFLNLLLPQEFILCISQIVSKYSRKLKFRYEDFKFLPMHPGSQFCSRSMSLEFVETEHGFQLATLDSAATGTQMVVHDHKRKSR